MRLATKWENSKEYTLALLEAMPADQYDFVPATDMRSFGEQAKHITKTLSWQTRKLGLQDLPEVEGEDKAAIITAYRQIFDVIVGYFKEMEDTNLKEKIEIWYGDSTKNRLVYLMDNHVAHHRGQMIVYLRLKGITPPKYVGW